MLGSKGRLELTLEEEELTGSSKNESTYLRFRDSFTNLAINSYRITEVKGLKEGFFKARLALKSCY
jgi:hypothetical protein